MFFKIFKIKSDYWLEGFHYCSFTEKYCNILIAFPTAEEDPAPSALPAVWLFRFYEAFHEVNYGGIGVTLLQFKLTSHGSTFAKKC